MSTTKPTVPQVLRGGYRWTRSGETIRPTPPTAHSDAGATVSVWLPGRIHAAIKARSLETGTPVEALVAIAAALWVEKLL